MSSSINFDHVSRAFSDINQLINENRELREILQRQAAIIDEQNRKIQQCGINVIINGKIFDDTYSQKFRDEYGISFDSPYFCIVSLTLHDFPSSYWNNGVKRMSVDQYKTTQTMLESACLDRLSENYTAYYTYSTVHFGAFLINLLDVDESRPEESFIEETEKLTLQFSAMLSEIQRDMGITFYAGVSSVYTGDRPFRLALQEAERVHTYLRHISSPVLSEHFYNFNRDFQSGKLSLPFVESPAADDYYAPDDDIQLNKKLEHQYYNCALSYDFSAAAQTLIGIIQELSCESVPRPDSAKLIAISHVESLLNSFGKSLYFGNSQLTDKMVISALDSAHDPVSFNSVVMDIFQEMESLFGNPGYKRRSIIDEMTEYIEKNFSNPNLNVNGICDHFGYNPSYISRIYKLSTGNGLLESIHRCRIIRAKELLQNTNLSVDQIFQDVGYSNRRTFDRAFKQQVGLSPAGYRAILPGKNP